MGTRPSARRRRATCWRTERRDTSTCAKVQEAYEAKLEPVLPYRTAAGSRAGAGGARAEVRGAEPRGAQGRAQQSPRVLIPVFPGTNCEYDTARALERAGAEPEVFVVQQPHPGPCGRERELL